MLHYNNSKREMNDRNEYAPQTWTSSVKCKMVNECVNLQEHSGKPQRNQNASLQS